MGFMSPLSRALLSVPSLSPGQVEVIRTVLALLLAALVYLLRCWTTGKRLNAKDRDFSFNWVQMNSVPSPFDFWGDFFFVWKQQCITLETI